MPLLAKGQGHDEGQGEKGDCGGLRASEHDGTEPRATAAIYPGVGKTGGRQAPLVLGQGVRHERRAARLAEAAGGYSPGQRGGVGLLAVRQGESFATRRRQAFRSPPEGRCAIRQCDRGCQSGYPHRQDGSWDSRDSSRVGNVRTAAATGRGNQVRQGEGQNVGRIDEGLDQGDSRTGPQDSQTPLRRSDSARHFRCRGAIGSHSTQDSTSKRRKTHDLSDVRPEGGVFPHYWVKVP